MSAATSPRRPPALPQVPSAFKYVVCADKPGSVLTAANCGALTLLSKHSETSTTPRLSPPPTTSPAPSISAAGSASATTPKSRPTAAAAVASSAQPPRVVQVALELRRVAQAMSVAGQQFEVFFGLWTGGSAVSEEFSVALPPSPTAHRRTVFRNVELNARSDLWLTCRVLKLTQDVVASTVALASSSSASSSAQQAAAQTQTLGGSGGGENSAGSYATGTQCLFRRPMAVGVLPVLQVASANSSAIPLFAPSGDTAWSDAPELLAGMKTTGLSPLAPQDASVEVSLQVHEGIYEDLLPRMPSLAGGILCNPIKSGDVFVPDPGRSDLYVTVECGRFGQGKHMELSMELRHCQPPGVVTQGGLQSGAGSSVVVGTLERENRLYKSPVWINNQTPTWRETVRLRIPLNSFHGSHLFFVVSQCHKSKPPTPFSFAFLRLSTDAHTLIKDGFYSVDCYKTASSSAIPPPSVYLLQQQQQQNLSSSSSLSSSGSGNGVVQTSPPLRKDVLVQRKGETVTVSIKSFYKLPSDERVAAALNWIDNSSRVAPIPADQVVDRLSCADADEVMRFLPEVQASLLSILEGTAQQVLEPLALKCYQALVTVLGHLVEDKLGRYGLYRGIYERHVEDGFSHRLAWHHLLRCMLYNFESDGLVVQTLRAMPLLLRIVVVSRTLFDVTRKPSILPSRDTEFKQQLTAFMKLLGAKLAASGSNSMFRTLTLRNFDSVMDSVSRFFSYAELCAIFVEIMDAIPFDSKLDSVNKAKLQLISRVIGGSLPIDGDTIVAVTPLVVTTTQEQPRASLPLLGKLLDFVHTHRTERYVSSVAPLLGAIVPSVVTIVRQLYVASYSAEARKSDRISTLLSTQSRLTHKEQYSSQSYRMSEAPLLDVERREKQQIVTTFLSLLSISHHLGVLCVNDNDAPFFFTEILGALGCVCRDTELYPREWCAMEGFRDDTAVRMLRLGRDALLRRVDNSACGDEAELGLWGLWFKLGIDLLDRFEEPDVAGLPRGAAASLLRECWVDTPTLVIPLLSQLWAAVPHKSFFFASLFGPVVHLLVQTKRIVGIMDLICDFYTGIAVDEFRKTGSMSRVMTRSCEVLDVMMRKKLCSSEVLRNFLSVSLATRFQSSAEDPSAMEQCVSLIDNLSSLLQLTEEFMDLPEGSEYEEERTVATMKMMNYFAKGNEMGSYFRYVHALFHEHLRAEEKKNFVEAAVTLLLHANAVPWTDEHLEAFEGATPSLPLPAEASWKRRERMYLMAAECFGKGGMWERGIELMKDLCAELKRRGELERLASVLEMMAAAYQSAAEAEPRSFPLYFRVGYYGHGFPMGVANKEFVVCTDPTDTLHGLAERLHRKFPLADVFSDAEQASSTAMSSPGRQAISVCVVDPSCEAEVRGDERVFPESMPRSVREFYRHNNVNVFVSAPAPADQLPQFHSVLRSKTFFVTEDVFPAIRRRSEIVKRFDVDLTPVEAAIDSVRQTINNLEERFAYHLATPVAPLTPLSVLLTAVVDDSVARSLPFYERTFFRAGPDNQATPEQTARLRRVLERLSSVVQHVLAYHEKECPPELRPVQAVLNGHVSILRRAVEALPISPS